jgi:hypothetical protein
MGYQHGRTGTGNPLSNNSPIMYAICTFKSRFIALISERRLEKNALSLIPNGRLRPTFSVALMAFRYNSLRVVSKGACFLEIFVDTSDGLL